MAQCVLHVTPMDMFSIFLFFAKSNDITNIFVQKIASTFLYYISMAPEHFEIKKKYIGVPYNG